MPQAHPINNPIIDAAKRELADRARTAAPLRTANYLAGDCIFPHEGVFGVVLKGGEVHIGDDIQVVKLGDGACSFTPAEALEEIEQAR